MSYGTTHSGGIYASIVAGNGGDAGGIGTGGTGGTVAHLDITQNSLFVLSGSGGRGFLAGNDGDLADAHISLVGSRSVSKLGLKSAGDIERLNLYFASYYAASFSVVGKSVHDLTLNNSSVISNASIATTEGGNIDQVKLINSGFLGFEILGGAGLPDGGSGGSISNVSIASTNHITSGKIFSGIGGGGSLNPSGDSGDITGISLYSPADTSRLAIVAGGTRSTSTSQGGSIGAISDINIKAPGGALYIGSSLFAGPPPYNRVGPVYGVNGVGGNGGDISNITAYVHEFVIDATDGGSAPSGTGGRGGNVSDVNVSSPSRFITRIAAGDGGDGATPGIGGSISKIYTDGDVGRFTAKKFGFDGFGEIGGLSVGRGGAGPNGAFAESGSVSKVTAARIAAIVAGAPATGVLGYQNAVTSISQVHASVIGADLGITGDYHVGRFDFNNPRAGNDGLFEPNAAHNPVDGDIAIDGLVLVKAAGLLTPLPVNPLLLVTV
jgi:hypothetical protein